MSIDTPTQIESDVAATVADAASTLPKPHAETQVERRRKVIAHPVPTRLRDRFPTGINWYNFFWMLGMHAAAVTALWHFSWQGLVACAVLHFVTACFGVTLGYHRLLTHGSLVVSKPVEYIFSIFGMLSAEGTPLFWVATHRKHHVLSDQEGDPHSPNDGFWWSHILWFKPHVSREDEIALYKRWAPDMYKDPVQRVFDRIFPVFPIALGAALFLIGEATMGSGWSLLLWGLCVRMVLCYHSTWFVNSATHVWGYRNYETTDRSRNLWWVALISYGEGWHNNHHAHQRLAVHGHKWWELDVTWQMIRLLRLAGLAKDVQDEIPAESL